MRRSTLLSFCAAALLGGLSLSGTAFGNWFGNNSFDYYYGYSWGPGCPDGTDIEGRYSSLDNDELGSIGIEYPTPMKLEEVEGKSKVSTWCKTRITLAMNAGGTVGDIQVSNNLTKNFIRLGEKLTVNTVIDPGTLDLFGPDRSGSTTVDANSSSQFAVHDFHEVGNIGAPSCNFYRYATFTVTTELILEYNSDDDNIATGSIEASFLNFTSPPKESNAIKCAPLFHSLW